MKIAAFALLAAGAASLSLARTPTSRPAPGACLWSWSALDSTKQQFRVREVAAFAVVLLRDGTELGRRYPQLHADMSAALLRRRDGVGDDDAAGGV